LSDRGPNVIVVSAPSGAGKSTVLFRVLRELPGLRFSISHTTRPRRGGEADGVEYHFVSEAAFEAHRAEGGFLEWAEVYGHRYGTSRHELMAAQKAGVDLLLDVDPQGAAQVRRHLPEAVSVFIMPPSYGELEKRLRGRGQDDAPAIARRLRAAHEELETFEAYDYVLLNENLDACVEDLKSLIRAARRRTARMRPAVRGILRTFESAEAREREKKNA
jgi:guanylate kinase